MPIFYLPEKARGLAIARNKNTGQRPRFTDVVCSSCIAVNVTTDYAIGSVQKGLSATGLKCIRGQVQNACAPPSTRLSIHHCGWYKNARRLGGLTVTTSPYKVGHVKRNTHRLMRFRKSCNEQTQVESGKFVKIMNAPWHILSKEKCSILWDYSLFQEKEKVQVRVRVWRYATRTSTPPRIRLTTSTRLYTFYQPNT